HVVMLDILHDINEDDQRRLLNMVATSIAPGGIAATRQCPWNSSNRFKLTNVVDRLVCVLRWHKSRTINLPVRETIVQPFHARGFTEEIFTIWGWTPFNKYLFVFRRSTDNALSGGMMNNEVWI
ncbi:MAG: hypothetical protein ABI618_18630, partial [Nitrospirota bacterium]